MELNPRRDIQNAEREFLSFGAKSRGAEIKLPPGAGAEITDCGSGSSFGFGSFLFIKD
jgi:hypothetical protein